MGIERECELSRQESRRSAWPQHKRPHASEPFRWSATWNALMRHLLVAMLREKTLCADSVDLMVSDHAKETDNAVALIAMKIAKRQQLNQQQRSRQRGLPPLLD